MLAVTYEIATIPGDGIGPEVIDATLPLFETVASRHDAEVEFTTYDWGSDYYLKNGQMMPDDGIDTLRGSDSILLGAVGHPDVPDHITLHGLLLPIRKQFNQQVCKRPSILFEGVDSPLAGYSSGDIDFVVFRENTEGEYSTSGGVNTSASNTRSPSRARSLRARERKRSSVQRSRRQPSGKTG